ncbi:pilus assembly protein [Noviherbaspirillum denitrificans]|uniref:pilus assembly protein n=1 Tax=Noviherbaspirillum denitrificans TaxID=1968433 RepID=UPI00148233F4|nr:PilC/PilY family type IV pilus protein [Noviherbaspirillum denitrificans]
MTDAVAARMPLADTPIAAEAHIPANVLFVLSNEFTIAEIFAYRDNPGRVEFVDAKGLAGVKECPGLRTFKRARIGDKVNELLCYFKEISYPGYFDPNKCYDYDPAILSSTADNTRGAFIPKEYTNRFHECSRRWSGNFLNWATAQVADIIRIALTGGNRSVDTASTTILEKAKHTGRVPNGINLRRIGGNSFTQNDLTVTPVDRSTVTPFPSNANAPLYLRLSDQQIQISDGLQMQVSEEVNFFEPESFYVRVKVCDPATGLEQNCKKFGQAAKPVGLIQDYSHAMRFGATSYVVDNEISRTGGVLRARIKDVGPRRHVGGKGLVDNPEAQWSAANGVFLANPDHMDAAQSGVRNSGVVNYLNKLGRTSGYKTFDPTGELYYESLRYLRGLSPTPEYLRGIDKNMKDGFPVITEWEDPIQFSCQRNFIITVSDGGPWCDTLVPGNTFVETCSGHAGAPSVPDPAIDATALTNQVGALEGMDKLGLTYPWRAQWNSYYIAGLAYWANTQDIRPDDTAVPHTIGKQTVQSFFVNTVGSRIGLKNPLWLAAKYGGPEGIEYQSPPRGNENPEAQERNPSNYFTVSNTRVIDGVLNRIFSTIAASSRTSASTGVAFQSQNGTASVSKGSSVYQTFFTSTQWSGDVAGGNLEFNNEPSTASFKKSWSAASLLDQLAAGDGWKSKRKIVTMSAGRAVPFARSRLSASQQRALGHTVAAQTDMVEYIRGNRNKEKNAFRERVHLLGDIVHSGAMVVADKDAPYSESAHPGYAAFKAKARTKMIYAGANDGMLHAFNGETDLARDANGGQEVWAYIPSFVIIGPSGKPSADGLAAIASRAKPYTHRYHVDAPLEVRDVDFSDTKDAKGAPPDWRTLLVGGLGKGGKGFYALDVTDGAAAPSEEAAAGKVLWEFTDRDMGFSYGRPVIVHTAKDGWVVLLTSGYDNGSGKNKGEGFLYVVNARTGKLIQKIGTHAHGEGLAQGAVYVDNAENFTAGQFYAGDLLGNVWRFDLSIKAGKYPPPAKLAALTSPDGKPQPVTAAPRIAISTHQQNRWVLVGTGRDLAPADAWNPQQQTMYAIRDGSKEMPSAVRNPLTRRDFSVVMDGGPRLPLPGKGWLVDMQRSAPSAGSEQITQAIAESSGIVSFLGKSASDDPCRPLGTGNAYAVELESGFSVLKDSQGKPKRAYSGDAFTSSVFVRLDSGLAIVLADINGNFTVPYREVQASGKRK